MPNLIIERLSPDIPMPQYAHEGDSGFDLYAAEDVPVPEDGKTVKVSVGIKATIPHGHEVQVRPRSSMGGKGWLMPNSPGTIDCGYTGEWFILLTNNGWVEDSIRKGDRIAQAVLAPVTRAVITEGIVRTDTERGEGGFGSTGK